MTDLVGPLLDELPQVLLEVVGLLREEWPDYAAFLEEDPDDVLRQAQIALRQLVELAQHGPGVGGGALGGTTTFEEVGRIEWREGRSLATLLSAYRAGARVAWRHMSRAALRRDAPPEAIASLAEAVFVFVEELSSASARGYVDEQLATAAERERVRAELADQLLSERVDVAAVRLTAAAAGWVLPETIALIVVPPAHGGDLHARLDVTALPVRRPAITGAIVPDPDGPGRRARLATALRGLDAVVGPTVATAQLPTTVRATTVAATLASGGVLGGDPVFVDDNYDALLVHSDPALLERLTKQVLTPLAGEATGSRARLEETLRAWLETMGDRQAIAARLHVHPQTVRYRMGRLHALYGTALDDPRTRLRLTLALCWR